MLPRYHKFGPSRVDLGGIGLTCIRKERLVIGNWLFYLIEVLPLKKYGYKQDYYQEQM